MDDLERLHIRRQRGESLIPALKRRDSIINNENSIRKEIQKSESKADIKTSDLNLLERDIPINTLTSMFETPFMPVNEYSLRRILYKMDSNYYQEGIASDKTKPYLLITAGAPASGKSNFKRRTIDQLLNTVEISIDDYVENDTTYKNEVIDIILDWDLYVGPNKSTGEAGRINPDNRDLLDHPELIEAFNRSYFSAKERHENERMNDVIEAVKKRKNIIIETTGKKLPLKYLNNVKGYNIIFLYILIPEEKQREMIITRATTKIVSFMNDVDNNPAPRLPNTTETNISEKNEDMIDILNDVRAICECKREEIYEFNVDNYDPDNIWAQCEDVCKSNNVTLVVYNNYKKLPNPILVYDHTRDYHFDQRMFNSIIHGVLHPRPINIVNKKTLRRYGLGGKKKKITHKKKNKKKSKGNLKKRT